MRALRPERDPDPLLLGGLDDRVALAKPCLRGRELVDRAARDADVDRAVAEPEPGDRSSATSPRSRSAEREPGARWLASVRSKRPSRVSSRVAQEFVPMCASPRATTSCANRSIVKQSRSSSRSSRARRRAVLFAMHRRSFQWPLFDVVPAEAGRAWRRRDSNPRPPRCKAGALPVELHPRSRSVRTGGVEPPQRGATALQAAELAGARRPQEKKGGRPDSNRYREDHDLGCCRYTTATMRKSCPERRR